MSMFNLFKISRSKPQPTHEYLTQDGMALFYEQTVTNIKQHVMKILAQQQSGKSTKQTQDTQIDVLRKSCESVLEHMKRVSDAATSKEKKAERLEKDMKVNINMYFEPLQYALLPDIMDSSAHQAAILATHEQVIDCIQKLFLYGYIELGIKYTGKIPVENVPTQPHVMLIDVVVKVVCDCFSASSSLSKKSSAVQLVIVKAMLTGITSCGMHGKSLRRAITTCLNIYLVNRDSVVLETAKASLSQMVNSVFHRMVDHQNEYDPTSVAEDDDMDEQEMDFQMRQDEPPMEEQKDVSEMTESERIVHEYVTDIFERVAQDIVNSGSNGYETVLSEVKQPKSSNQTPAVNQNYHFQNLYEKDAFYLLRQLLQLSRKKLDIRNPTTLNALHISLEFILDILRKYSDTILSSAKGRDNLFIRDIKYTLCLSLIKNSVASQIALFELSIRILEVLLRQGFSIHLRSELPPLLLSFLIRCLSTDSASAEQKLIVLTTFQNCIAKDSQLLVDLFVNYDSALGQENVFEAVIRTLCDLCKNVKAELGWIAQPQEQKIRSQTLQVISSILQYMVKFMDEHKIENSEAHIEKQRADKLLYANAAKIFNEKPAKGIEFLVKAGKLPDADQEPERAALEIAKFLYENRNTILSKKMIGEYIGGHKELNSLVRKYFTELQSFKDMGIVPAIRSYLNSFRLPGEGQIVERVVETFSKHYYHEVSSSPTNVYANEDAPYLVAYSIIMLNTELHNPAFAFRERMGEPMYIASLGGTNGGGDFPDQLLSSIYQDIKSNEIKMEGEEQLALDPLSAYNTSSLTLVRKKQIVYDEETRRAYKKEKRLFNRLANQYMKKSEPMVYNAKSRSHIKSMFQISWQNIHSVVCDLLKRFDDEQIVELCLSLYNSCIHISARFELDEERDAFMVSLADFSKLSKKIVINLADQLNPTLIPQAILTQKNLDCMNLLLSIARNEGDYLKQSWQHILQCISELERLRSLTNTDAYPDDKKNHRRSSSTIESLNYSQHLSSIIKKNVKSASIDAVYSGTVKLTNEAFLYFAESLCKISDKELSEEESRKYSLARLVEIVATNLTPDNKYARIRAVWPQLWKSCLFAHYMKFGTSDNTENSMAVIDSLRQLAAKILECESLAQEETFQQNYLKPFHEIIQQSDNNLIRELIIECVGNLAMKFFRNIEVGWPLILHTLSWANRIIPNTAQKTPRKKYTESAHIIQLGFEFAVNILKEPCFSFVCRNKSFVACVSCLCAFAKQQLLPQIALRSIELLTDSCAKQIVSEKVIPLRPIDGESAEIRFSEKIEIHGQIWRPILLQLSSSASEARIEMRIRSIETLFKLLKENGRLYSSGFWRMVFSDVLFPIFNEITAPRVPLDKAPSSPTSKNVVQFAGLHERTFSDSEWIRTTCHKAMICLVDLFVEYFDAISFMLKDIMQIICACFKKDRPTDILCQIGNGCIYQLVSLTGSRFSSEHWDLICDYIGQCAILMDAASNFSQSPSISSSNFQDTNFLTCISIQCRAQLLLLDTCNDILAAHYENMETKHTQKLLQSLLTSYESARNLNTSQAFGSFLKAHMSASVPLTEFITQETKALSLYLNTLFRMIADSREKYQDRVQLAHKLLIPLLDQLFRRFLHQVGVHNNKTNEDKDSYLGTYINPKETDALIPVVVLALGGFANFSQEIFVQYIFPFYPLFCDLVMQTSDKNNEIRNGVRKILMKCQMFIPRNA